MIDARQIVCQPENGLEEAAHWNGEVTVSMMERFCQVSNGEAEAMRDQKSIIRFI